MHHGYYPKGGEPRSHQAAQVDMVERTLDWAGVKAATKVREEGAHQAAQCSAEQ
jgi:tocopherol O-methyltransferase